MNSPTIIRIFSEKRVGMTNQIQSNLDVVLFALEKLGGATRKVPTEKIAAETAKLAPDRFCWVMKEYHSFPDKYVTKTTLEDAAKPKYGQLVQGKYARELSRDGWVLTPSGIQWLKNNHDRIALALSQGNNATIKLSPLEEKRFKARMSQDKAYQFFTKNGHINDISWFLVAALLQVSPDSSKDIINRKYDQLMSVAQLIEDSEIISFLTICKEKFDKYFDTSKGGNDDWKN